MKIKALSLWQPWASLIAVGAKKHETRSWATNYRGPLLICAGSRPFRLKMFTHSFLRLLEECLGTQLGKIPYGKALAVADLSNCRLMPAWTDLERILPDMAPYEGLFGDYSPGRYAWKLENVQAIEPFPVKGRQGLFEVEIAGELEKAVRELGL